jgi:class I fructose-bisphosphate aldolase
MKTEREVLEMVYGALQAGAKGLSIGRNVFQAKNRVQMVKALYKLVHENASVEEAISLLEGGK